jgi:hypothetical protein
LSGGHLCASLDTAISRWKLEKWMWPLHNLPDIDIHGILGTSGSVPLLFQINLDKSEASLPNLLRHASSDTFTPRRLISSLW